MRTFFALDLDEESRRAVVEWRRRSLPAIGREVAPRNLHVTLCFLGELSRPQVERLGSLADRAQCEAFGLRMDRLEYLPKNGTLWMGAEHAPPELLRLVKRLRADANRVGVKREKRPFRPHLTLLRRCETRPPLPVDAPVFELACGSFTLFKSVFGRKGVRYEALGEWPLSAALEDAAAGGG